MKKVVYIVQLKKGFTMPGTSINRERQFAGYIDNITACNFYFRLCGSHAFVIVPHNEIEWMAPSVVYWDAGYRYED